MDDQQHRRVHERAGPDPAVATSIRTCRSTAPASEEWRGYVSFKNHPQGINPPNGEIVNWNNRPQAGYEAPIDNWSLGAIQRVDLLLHNLGNGEQPDPGAGRLGDERGRDPGRARDDDRAGAVKVLRGGQRAERRDAKMLSAARTVAPPGRQPARPDRQRQDHGARRGDHGHRLAAAGQGVGVQRARADADSQQLANWCSIYDQPPGGQYTGWHMYMYKDLRTMLGSACAASTRSATAAAATSSAASKLLWGAINQAGSSWPASRAPTRPTGTRARPPRRSRSCRGCLTYKMRYTNRPTGIQQVLSFGGHAPGDG